MNNTLLTICVIILFLWLYGAQNQIDKQIQLIDTMEEQIILLAKYTGLQE